jgi:hypothetical protein
MARKGETIPEGDFAFVAVTRDVWREFAKQHMLCDNDGAFRKAWNTVRNNRLVARGHVGFRGDYIWPLQPDPRGGGPF